MQENVLTGGGSTASINDNTKSPPPKVSGSTGGFNQGHRGAFSASHFANTLKERYRFITSQNGDAFMVIEPENGNANVLLIGSKPFNNFIRELAMAKGQHLRKQDIQELNDLLTAHTEMSGSVAPVWSRVAPIEGGIEIDLCDPINTRVSVTAGNVKSVTHGSQTLFFRNPNCLSMSMPAEEGNLDLLNNYVNLTPRELKLLICWLIYTLAHPKTSTSKYVILVVQGDQGSGKSFLCRLILELIDPSQIGIQMFPKNGKDLSIAAQHAHVVCFDNMRGFKSEMSDVLCIASTGGAISNRALYSNGDQYVHRLHVAIVLNGIHSFIHQSDLAERCLCIRTKAMAQTDRKSDAQLAASLAVDMPLIFRGLLDLIADVLSQLSNVEITQPERMIDFVHWLAALEKVQNAPLGAYQSAYSDMLHQAQLDSLMDNLLAAAVMEFSHDLKDKDWVGSPAELLNALNFSVPDATQRSYEWPKNPIALSKRLNSLKASLATQGVVVDFNRGKQRTITIKFLREHKHV